MLRFIAFSEQLLMGVLVLMLVAGALMVARPNLMFHPTEEEARRHGSVFRAFGVGRHQTVLPFWLAILVAGLLAYAMSLSGWL